MQEDLEETQEEFRKYLDQTGLVKVLTSIIHRLYEEKQWPDDPLEFVRYHLECPIDVNVDGLKAENEALRLKNEELEITLDSLMDQLERAGSQKSGFN